MAENSLQIVEPSTTQIAKPQGFGPQTFQEALVFAQQLAKSSLVPEHYKGKAENILVAIQHGAELGLPPMQALNSIAVINGHPSIYGDAALAIVKGHRDFEWIRETFDDQSMTATCIVKRRGEPEVTQAFSKADAERANLWDDRKKISRRDGGEMSNPSPWYCYPKRMLKFRARGFALRDSFPDALRGIVTAEEAQDYGEGPTIEGQVSQTVPDKPVEETIGMQGGSEFYKQYKLSGWTPDEAKAWLRDNLQIGQPHNDKNSKDIPVSKKDKAFDWAKTIAPVRVDAEKLFDQLDWTKEERLKFFNDHKGDWPTIKAKLEEEVNKRNAQEQ